MKLTPFGKGEHLTAAGMNERLLNPIAQNLPVVSGEGITVSSGNGATIVGLDTTKFVGKCGIAKIIGYSNDSDAYLCTDQWNDVPDASANIEVEPLNLIDKSQDTDTFTVYPVGTNPLSLPIGTYVLWFQFNIDSTNTVPLYRKFTVAQATPVLVLITEHVNDGTFNINGYYRAQLRTGKLAFDPTQNLNLATQTAAGSNVIFINAAEQEINGHLLDIGDYVTGYLCGSVEDGEDTKPVVLGYYKFHEEFIGHLVKLGPDSQEDLTGNRYWFKSQIITNDENDAVDALLTTDTPVEASRYYFYSCATNLAEKVWGTHWLKIDTGEGGDYIADHPIVKMRYDQSAPSGALRFYFSLPARIIRKARIIAAPAACQALGWRAYDEAEWSKSSGQIESLLDLVSVDSETGCTLQTGDEVWYAATSQTTGIIINPPRDVTVGLAYADDEVGVNPDPTTHFLSRLEFEINDFDLSGYKTIAACNVTDGAFVSWRGLTVGAVCSSGGDPDGTAVKKVIFGKVAPEIGEVKFCSETIDDHSIRIIGDVWTLSTTAGGASKAKVNSIVFSDSDTVSFTAAYAGDDVNGWTATISATSTAEGGAELPDGTSQYQVITWNSVAWVADFVRAH